MIALLLEGESCSSCDRDHRSEVADHADVNQAVLFLDQIVMIGAFMSCREAVLSTQHLARQAKKPLPRVTTDGLPARAGLRNQPGEDLVNVEIVAQDRPGVTVKCQ